jgi:Domain of unknown function (DUF5602)
MCNHRDGRGIRLIVAASTALIFLVGCSGGNTSSSSTAGTNTPASNNSTVFGPSQRLGNGNVKTYTTLDGSGNPIEVGLRLTDTALDGLPPTTTPPDVLMLDFPDQASATPFDHVMLNWNPQGHDPVALFGKPHFDFHFDMVDKAAIKAVSPSDPNFVAEADRLPEPKYLPQDYVVPPGASAAAQAVPGMGVHLVDSSDTSLVPGSYDFKQIIINGAWNGKYTFIEPMITREWLLTKPTLEQQALKQPQAYQKTGYYPTNYSVRFDEQAKEYVVTLAGMTMRKAS